MDSVETAEYKVTLSYPDYDNPNTIHALDASGQPTQLVSLLTSLMIISVQSW